MTDVCSHTLHNDSGHVEVGLCVEVVWVCVCVEVGLCVCVDVGLFVCVEGV